MIKNIFLAIEKYNKYHSSEAMAKFVKYGKSFVVIGVSGPFNRSHSISDWFDDFKVELEKKRAKARIVDIKEKDETYLVKFNLKKGGMI